MAQQWFKFYGGEYLSDPKMLALNSAKRSCWLTLLCYASMNGSDGTVHHLSEEVLMMQSGVNPTSDEWDRCKGVMKDLVNLEMIEIDGDVITITNWKKRQDSFLTNAERQARYRKNKDSNDGVTDERNESNARIEKSRIEKKRIPTAKAEVRPFDFSKELAKLQESTRKDHKVIGLYWYEKGFKFENREQFNAALRRELRAASALKGYSGAEVGAAIDYCKKEYTVWTLETVGKRITDLVNVKK